MERRAKVQLTEATENAITLKKEMLASKMVRAELAGLTNIYPHSVLKDISRRIEAARSRTIATAAQLQHLNASQKRNPILKDDIEFLHTFMTTYGAYMILNGRIMGLYYEPFLEMILPKYY